MASERWLELMGRDKKVIHGRLRFVLLERIGVATLRSDVDAESLSSVLED